MIETGIIRRMDDLGRVSIPLKIRETLNLGCEDRIELSVGNDGTIILKPYNPKTPVYAAIPPVFFRDREFPLDI